MKQRIVFGILMSLLLSSLMTLWVTWLNLGMTPAFFAAWGKAFVCAWPAAAAIAISLGPYVQRMTTRLLRPR
ncbi:MULTISPECIES: DUF2798 domain-containing protein [Vibrio]|uniref:DUF2798 domain-containing protein n=2 Tax=Vibrio coralliilyticus TaxID=190893 RepID=A0AAN0W0K7_9VIBR|nr:MULTISPECIES: DUF2798 domain-containing protein [Vibrio]AIW22968.1 hypothetical protein IX92_28530 [Vibrio coralliilyticus]NOH38252.1 DUF2798 domain-containing protein [Vibrio coralliilyticus]NOH55035.1 DUF2798 domain-containing protein [Vibrio coralliilyticus]PAU35691.1 DUF2798 domain-containing protein [Vibrio coralliilyticus]QFT39987.1 hypothetical protein FIU99_26720 [Vibrio sp. THAF64]